VDLEGRNSRHGGGIGDKLMRMRMGMEIEIGIGRLKVKMKRRGQETTHAPSS
jgi:hypothetical protein